MPSRYAHAAIGSQPFPDMETDRRFDVRNWRAVRADRLYLRAMNTTPKRYVYKVTGSPVGTLTLVGSDEGLAGILWPKERAGRVRLPLETVDTRHPVLMEAEQQLKEYFAGRRRTLLAEAGLCRHRVSEEGLGRAADDPLWRDAVVRRDRAADRPAGRRAGGRRRQREEPGVDRRAVPPGGRVHRHAHGICRRPRSKGAPAGARRRPLDH